jgi:Domain of unknown function (DUF4337)
MEADEAAEMMDREKEESRFRKRAAVTIAFFAMLLAITGLGGQNATKEALNSNIQASNYFNFFQAKNMRQTASSSLPTSSSSPGTTIRSCPRMPGRHCGASLKITARLSRATNPSLRREKERRS